MPNSNDWRYFCDASGNQLPAIGPDTLIPVGAIEIPSVPTTGLDKADLVNKVWIPYEPPLEEQKKAAYQNDLGGLPNQIDAVYKGLLILIPAFAKAGLLTPEEVEILTPNKDARPDTPAGWLGKVKDIKERFPK